MDEPRFLERDIHKLALELSPAGMLLADSRGTILLVNREVERQFGYPREELIGHNVDMLVPVRSRGRHPSFRSRYDRSPTPRPMGAGRDLTGLRKDGSEFPLEIGLNPVATREDSFVLAMIVDISERRRVEVQLRQSQKMETMGVLAGGIAHDFNNLLHGIVGHSELAMRALGDNAQAREDLERILEAAERGRQLVRRISLFSRQGEPALSPIQLERPVREALQLLRASLPRNIAIREVFDPNAPPVLSDETQITQVVMNLATNASHAMPDGGLLEVTLQRFEVDDIFAGAHPGLALGPHVLLSVADSGTGMPPEVLERALEPFFTTKPPGIGTGLGLATVHSIVQHLGGVLGIWSRPGRGTRVDAYFPALRAGRGAGESSAHSAARPDARRVLLVDDERDLAMMLRRLLEDIGYRATVHTSSLEALAEFRAHPTEFDALMTDNSMVHMSGLVLAQEVRRIRPDFPVILLSGASPGVEPELLGSSGIARVLSKPCTAREMDLALRSVLGEPGSTPR